MDKAGKFELSEPLANLFQEISRECRLTLKLIEELKGEGLSVEQLETMLTRIADATFYLHSHTSGMQDLIFDEIEKLHAKKHKAERELRKESEKTSR
jgi:hypothetical protein